MVEAIDREVGFIKDALKFSYLLLRTDGRTIADRRPDLYRIVSELRVFKGESRVWVCNEAGRAEVGRLDRRRSVTNEAWNRLRRGTIVELDGIVKKEGATLGRIPENGLVQIVRSV